MRQNNATLDVRGTNLGDASGRRALLRIGDATNQTAFIAAMVGGGSASGTNQSIVPWMIAEDVSNAGVGDGNMELSRHLHRWPWIPGARSDD